MVTPEVEITVGIKLGSYSFKPLAKVRFRN